EESVLRRLHDHLARLATDLEIGKDHLLRRGEVPRVAGRGLVVPDDLSAVRVEGKDRGQIEIVSAARASNVANPRPAVAGAAVADEDLAFDDARSAGDRVRPRLVDGDLLPQRLSGLRVERDQPSVECADKDLALVDRNAAIDDVAAGFGSCLSGNLRIISPQ